MFLATTNQICQDVAVVPLLWVMPLSLYLLSFVICFEKPGWYSRGLFHPLFAVGLFLVCFLISGGALTKIVPQIAIYSFNLFACCMVCHGELARAKPSSRNLTSFHLMVGLGGALGGIFVALIAPLVFPDFWELQIGLWASALLLFIALSGTAILGSIAAGSGCRQSRLRRRFFRVQLPGRPWGTRASAPGFRQLLS